VQQQLGGAFELPDYGVHGAASPLFSVFLEHLTLKSKRAR
jgi:hypothetical protein